MPPAAFDTPLTRHLRYYLLTPREGTRVDIVWLAVVVGVFAASDLLVRLLSSLQGEE